MTHSIEAVLFDFDGTLVDTVDLIMESFRYATREVLGEPLPDDVITRNIGIPLDAQMKIFSPEKGEELSRVYRAHNLEIHDTMIKEYEGTRETLTEIQKSGLPMAIITSKMRYMAMRAFDLFKFDPYFEFLIAADDVEKHKPDPYPLLVAANRLDVSIERCIYIGDSPHDMNAAISANAISVAALWGAFPEEDVLAPGPQYALRRIQELPNLLDKL